MTGANGYSCKVFLLCGYEVGFYNDPDKYMRFPQDGAKLDYFITGNNESTANERRKAWLTGETHGYNGTAWWLRTGDSYATTCQWCVATDGHAFNGTVTNLFGLRPAIIMPSDTLINTSTYTIIT